MNKVVWVRKDDDPKLIDVETSVLEMASKDGEYAARVSPNGCIVLVHNWAAGETPDQLHICHVDELIDHLLDLKCAAKEHFGEEWES